MAERKKVTIAPGTKVKEDEKPNKSANSTGKKRDGTLSRTLNPIQRSKENIKRSYDVRRTREKYGDKIKSIQEEQDNDIRDLTEKIKYYKKENEKLIRQQKMQYGLTLDEMNNVKEELEQARDTNDALYHQVEARKEECEKLQSEIDILVERINALTLDKSDLIYEKKLHEAEKVKLEQTEFKIQGLIKSNRQLRSLLLHNKINPSTDASKITPTPLVKTASPKNEHAKFYQEPADGRLPVIYDKKSLMSFRSMEDVRPNKRAPKQAPLRRSRSYNQQAIQHYMSPQEYFRRRRSEVTTRMHPSRLAVLV